MTYLNHWQAIAYYVVALCRFIVRRRGDDPQAAQLQYGRDTSVSIRFWLELIAQNANDTERRGVLICLLISKHIYYCDPFILAGVHCNGLRHGEEKYQNITVETGRLCHARSRWLGRHDFGATGQGSKWGSRLIDERAALQAPTLIFYTGGYPSLGITLRAFFDLIRSAHCNLLSDPYLSSFRFT